MFLSLKLLTCMGALMILVGNKFINGQTNNDLQDCLPFDVIVLLDSSVSLRDSDPVDTPLQTWKMMTNFTNSFLEKLPTDKSISVAAVKYSSTAEIIQDWTPRQGFSGINQNSLTFVGHNTNTAEALSKAKEILARSSSRRKIAVLMTDGLSTLNLNSINITAQNLRSIAEVFSVGISEYLDEKGLSQIASSPETKYFLKLRGEGEMNNILNVLARRVCNLPDTTVPPPPKCATIPNCEFCIADSRKCTQCEPGYFRDVWTCDKCPDHCVNCTSETNCADCEIGYYKDTATGKCIECTKGIFDLALLIDSSGSIRDKNLKDKDGNVITDNFLIILNFAQQITDGLPISASETRVSVISFSNTAQIVFYLNSYYDRASIRDQVGITPFEGGFTNITGAMRLMRTGVFLPEKGDRSDVPNVCILITDGKSTREEADAIPEAGRVKATGTKILAVGVTNEIGEDELTAIVSEPIDDHYFYSPDILTVKENVLQKLRNTLCST